MKSNDDVFKEFQQSLEGIKGNLHVLDTSVPVEKQMEYFKYSDDVRKNRGDQSIDSLIASLNAEDTDLDERKYAMTFLSVSGDVKAYRALESYTQNHQHSELDDWARMSLLQAKITLESEFSDEKQVFISTGLGGKEDKLRFFILFKSNHLTPFSPYQIGLIEKEIPFFIHEYQGEIEEIKISENYFTVVFLISMKINIKSMLDDALNECNQYGDFVSRSYIITNVKIFTEKEIKKELLKS